MIACTEDGDGTTCSVFSSCFLYLSEDLLHVIYTFQPGACSTARLHLYYCVRLLDFTCLADECRFFYSKSFCGKVTVKVKVNAKVNAKVNTNVNINVNVKVKKRKRERKSPLSALILLFRNEPLILTILTILDQEYQNPNITTHQRPQTKTMSYNPLSIEADIHPEPQLLHPEPEPLHPEPDTSSLQDAEATNFQNEAKAKAKAKTIHPANIHPANLERNQASTLNPTLPPRPPNSASIIYNKMQHLSAYPKTDEAARSEAEQLARILLLRRDVSATYRVGAHIVG